VTETRAIAAARRRPIAGGIAVVLGAALAGVIVVSAMVPFPQTQTQPGAIKAYRFGRIWTGDRVITNGTIIVTGDRITSIGTGFSVPADAEVIDLRPLTALPGLIDAHTHMTYGWDGAAGTTPLKQGQRTPAERMQLAAANARKTLETGVTTVRDLGAAGGTDIAMRDEIAAGRMVGPRMFVAGQGISAGRGGGGGPDPAAMAKTTEARLATAADWVKVYASRGSYQSVDTTQTITYEELKAIVDTAHAKGRKVAIHSYGPSGVKDAVRAGADSVEHGIELDDETIAEMAKRGTVWVPTVDHNRYYVDAKDEFQFAADTIPPLLAYIDKNLESVRRAFRGGVRIAMGSDAVYSMFGQNTRELGWFVKAGMTPEQALRTATTIGADLLGMSKGLGRLSAGAFADIIAVDGNPLQDIDALFTGVRWVMKNGVVIKKP
jgi:imidazolonepropionase-like amidohydrolase